jgi:hypothetical protein
MKACPAAAFLASERTLRLAILFFYFAVDEAAAQISHAFGQSTQCDLTSLNAQIDKLNDSCCINPQTSEKKNQQCDLETCDTDCVSVLVPLLDECGQLLQKLYDGADGKYDGHAQVFGTVYSQCLDIPTSKILDDLKALHAQGLCPDTALDGVASVEVAASTCEDTWLNAAGCEAGVLSGLLSCDKDFCATAPTLTAPCGYAGQCDLTCNVCTVNSEGHRRRRLLQELLHRRAQQLAGFASHCTFDTFSAELQRVEDACCDTGTQSTVCASGVPTECDAKCAIVYNYFYSQCSRLLVAQIGLTAAGPYDQLFSTCTESLPKEPLLRVLALCSSTPPDPCKGVECGDYGSCDGGSCRCELGYAGSACDFFDLCVGVECGHGCCDGGNCRCDHGYSGSHCETTDPCQVPAPVICGTHGSCDGGNCVCEEEYTGTLCENPPKPCCSTSIPGCFDYCGDCDCSDCGSSTCGCNIISWCDAHRVGWDADCNRNC